ncbi:prolyl oligopeptidase family serine peptidase [Sphingomonas quercus]|uniref:Prolyl oligopeptidase family serine peptidase n=1 Tax=Sphingomonas quercus TaxID=2842451 RepID=A0ABS6BDP5_9SPHN|nr:prolyl oligopeptidase family serine peptidase [Sphingomonas quercus]MBU3076442.1 prolyl oligopeptidase family serine peptidase [Sphingomonas quercus]
MTRTGTSIALALLAGTWALPFAAPPAFAQVTLDNVLGAPLPGGLTASPADGRVAWVSNERGVRNILIAERAGDGWSTRKLTNFAKDNGYELDRIAWAAKGSVLLYTGGGSLEGGGPINPESLVTGPLSKEIFAQKPGEAARSFGAGEGPTASPVDGRFVFTRGGQLWIADVNASGPAVQLIRDRGNSGGPVWSPDGSKLAFLSRRREGHVLLGIYDFTSKQISWVSPSTDRDASPRWSPDGKRIAWIRTPPTASQLMYVFRGKREGTPWSIWVADVASGKSAPVWTADAGAGSVFQPVEDGTTLLWTANDRLVFPWEKTRWLRLYSIPAQGGQPVALTPDGSELFAAELDRARTGVIFSSNAADDDHRHLWEVAAAGGTPRPITRGASIEDMPVVGGDGALYALHATARNPMQPVLVSRDGAMKPVYAASDAASFPAKDLVEPQRVVFQSSDNMPVHGQLFMPPGKASGPRPAILFFHGGPPRQMLLGWHPMGPYARFYAMNQFLASQGYVVLSVNFRGGTGYGMDWREALDFAEAGASEVRDIAGAVAYLKGRGDIDPRRIGAYGMSYGGIMTALALSKLPGDFAAGVDMAGVHNWTSFLPYLTAPGAPPELARIATASSAISSAKDWRAPVLFIHGDDDRAVVFSQTVEMIGALNDAGGKVQVEQFVLPGEVHDFVLHSNWLKAYGRTQEFLQRKLMNAK